MPVARAVLPPQLLHLSPLRFSLLSKWIRRGLTFRSLPPAFTLTYTTEAAVAEMASTISAAAATTPAAAVRAPALVDASGSSDC